MCIDKIDHGDQSWCMSANQRLQNIHMPPMTSFVAYYRVSTDRQGASGLGLDAQRESVSRFVGAGQLAAAFTEVESGRKDTNRPQLQAALTECRKRKATLLIARLDRLARNVAFIANLMESGVDFVAVDMPQANRLTIHILAAVAEHEREMISARTKAALAQAKARGTRLGNPQPHEALKLANAAKAHLGVIAESSRNSTLREFRHYISVLRKRSFAQQFGL